MNEDCAEATRRTELLGHIRRLTNMLLDKLDQGSKDGTLDLAQARMLGSIALRSLRLWHQVLERKGRLTDSEENVLEAETRLARKLEFQGKGGKA